VLELVDALVVTTCCPGGGRGYYDDAAAAASRYAMQKQVILRCAEARVLPHATRLLWRYPFSGPLHNFVYSIIAAVLSRCQPPSASGAGGGSQPEAIEPLLRQLLVRQHSQPPASQPASP
jgi:hypothetical protein